jgi:DNA-binding SARP family transcriptional activator
MRNVEAPMGKEIAIKGEIVQREEEELVVFRLLGAFHMSVAGRSQWPGPEQVQRLLVKLLAANGMPVGNDELMRAIWNEVPGTGATSESLHHLVGVARRSLATVGLEGVLVNERGSYRLDVPPAQVDIHVFHVLTARAREAARVSGQDAVVLLEQALRLRAGEPLAGLRGDWIDRYRQTLVDELWAAEQALYETAIKHGEAHERLPGLSALHRDRPDDERMTWLYMHALYRDGQQIEALEVKREFERYLRDSYGMDCGRALNDLSQSILRQDAALLTPEAVSFPVGQTGARAMGLGPQGSRADQDGREAEPDQPPADQAGGSPGDETAGQRREAPAAPASYVFNGSVDARYAVIGPQFNNGASR